MHAAVPFYNNERPHRSIEMLTPMEAAGRTGRFKRGWMSYRERAIDNLDRETLPPYIIGKTKRAFLQNEKYIFRDFSAVGKGYLTAI